MKEVACEEVLRFELLNFGCSWVIGRRTTCRLVSPLLDVDGQLLLMTRNEIKLRLLFIRVFFIDEMQMRLLSLRFRSIHLLVFHLLQIFLRLFHRLLFFLWILYWFHIIRRLSYGLVLLRLTWRLKFNEWCALIRYGSRRKMTFHFSVSLKVRRRVFMTFAGVFPHLIVVSKLEPSFKSCILLRLRREIGAFTD